MVNYCCIQSCGRNSRINKHLNFYSLPKERHRQKQWLKLACREDLLNKDMDKLRKTLRFCSRHFLPNSIVNRHLSPDALPTKSLPGAPDEDEPDIVPEKHEGIICDSCEDPILGFRYKCVTCDNYDLCQKCEMLETHSQHYMLRIPKSIKFQAADNLLNKWRKFFKAEHVVPDSELSSDDEPVTKYIKNYNRIVDLSEDVKKDILKEVTRAMVAAKEKKTNTIQGSEALNSNVNGKTVGNEKETDDMGDIPHKKIKIDNSKKETPQQSQAPELVFADVNAVKYDQNEVKPNTSLALSTSGQGPVQTQPLLYMILSNDLTQFMIEVAPTSSENTS